MNERKAPSIAIQAALEPVFTAMKLDKMPAPHDLQSPVPDTTWNTEVIGEVVTLMLQRGVEHGVHPELAMNQVEVPEVGWRHT